MLSGTGRALLLLGAVLLLMPYVVFSGGPLPGASALTETRVESTNWITRSANQAQQPTLLPKLFGKPSGHYVAPPLPQKGIGPRTSSHQSRRLHQPRTVLNDTSTQLGSTSGGEFRKL
jgi:hypothetical protein